MSFIVGIVNDAHQEITRLHKVIAGWLSGSLPRTPENFAGFSDSLAADFTIGSPDGSTMTKAELLATFEAAHGSAPGLAIEIRGFELVAEQGGLVVANYQEWQTAGDALNSRQSTVAFLRDGNGSLQWRHLQETWIIPLR